MHLQPTPPPLSRVPGGWAAQDTPDPVRTSTTPLPYTHPRFSILDRPLCRTPINDYALPTHPRSTSMMCHTRPRSTPMMPPPPTYHPSDARPWAPGSTPMVSIGTTM